MDDFESGLFPPMLLLSNNVDMATDHWLMGYLPEQQLDGLLGHAISEGSVNLRLLLKIQFLANDSFPMQIRDWQSLKPEAFQILSEDLADEVTSKQACNCRYVPA